MLLSDVLHERLLVDPERHHLRSEIAWHFGGGLPISAERSGQPRRRRVNATAFHQPDTTQGVSLHDDLTVACDQLVGVLGAALDHLEQEQVQVLGRGKFISQHLRAASGAA